MAGLAGKTKTVVSSRGGEPQWCDQALEFNGLAIGVHAAHLDDAIEIVCNYRKCTDCHPPLNVAAVYFDHYQPFGSYCRIRQ